MFRTLRRSQCSVNPKPETLNPKPWTVEPGHKQRFFHTLECSWHPTSAALRGTLNSQPIRKRNVEPSYLPGRLNMAPLKPISSRPYTHRSPTSTALKQRRVEFGVVYLRLDAFVQVFWRYRDSKGTSIEEHPQYDLRYIHCTLRLRRVQRLHYCSVMSVAVPVMGTITVWRPRRCL